MNLPLVDIPSFLNDQDEWAIMTFTHTTIYHRKVALIGKISYMLGVDRVAYWAGIWRVGMPISMYIFPYVNWYVHTSVCPSGHSYVLVYIYICLPVCQSISMFVHLYACLSVHVHICTSLICFALHPCTPVASHNPACLYEHTRRCQRCKNSGFVGLDIFTSNVCSDRPNDT